jgi:hypothetical protein
VKFRRCHPRIANHELIAGDAIRIFCRYSFGVLGLRKLLIEMPAEISGGVHAAAALSEAVTHEGTLRQHTLIGGALRDVDLFAVWSERVRCQEPVRAVGELSADAVVASSLREFLDDVPNPLSGGHLLVEDFGLDSLTLVMLLDSLEEACGCPLEVDVEGGPVCVRDLVVAVECATSRTAVGANGS